MLITCLSHAPLRNWKYTMSQQLSNVIYSFSENDFSVEYERIKVQVTVNLTNSFRSNLLEKPLNRQTVWSDHYLTIRFMTHAPSVYARNLFGDREPQSYFLSDDFSWGVDE